MALQHGQFQVRDLVMGPGTAYDILAETNPFTTQVRADQSGQRAWNHGGWSGAEWSEQRVVPLRILINTADEAAWLSAHQALTAAFRPVGDSASDVEMRFALGGSEFVLFGRPRMVEPETTLIGMGQAVTRAAFVALDPFIYSSVETVHANIGLPEFSGGLVIPGGGLAVPFSVTGLLSDSLAELTNSGTAEAGLLITLRGPAPQPRVVLQRADGEVQRLRFDFTVPAGSELVVDTKARTVTLGGINRRGLATGEFPTLPEGTHMLRWFASSYDPDASLTVTYRSAWW